MLCKFCRHEFEDSLTECPYCHRIVEVDAQSLTREERDSFNGQTIEADGSVRDESRRSGRDGSASRASYEGQAGYGQQDTPRNGSGSSRIHVYRSGGLLTWIMVALLIIGVVFFLLPAFLFIAVIGAIVGAIFFFVSGLFQ